MDDEPAVRRLCRNSLSDPRIEMDEVASGAAALEAAAAKQYDLILLDVGLPDMSGFEVLRRLREGPGGAHLRIMLLSGSTSADEMACKLLTGADDFVSKPFSPSLLQGRASTRRCGSRRCSTGPMACSATSKR